MILDDLHWMDRDSLELLEHVAAALRDTPSLLLATLRDHEAVDRDRAAVFGRLMRSARCLPLPGLALEDVSELVRRLALTPALEPELAERLHARTKGNPLFVRQLLEWMSRGPVDHDDAALPPVISEVLRRRVAALSAPTHQTLTAAAVLGDDWDSTVSR